MNNEFQQFIEEIKKLKDEIKIQNDRFSKNITVVNNEKKDVMYYIKRYIQEIFEASIGLLVLIIVMKKHFSLFDFSRLAVLIGLVTLILEEYNHEYLQNFKQGIHFTLGSVAFTH